MGQLVAPWVSVIGRVVVVPLHDLVGARFVQTWLGFAFATSIDTNEWQSGPTYKTHRSSGNCQLCQ